MVLLRLSSNVYVPGSGDYKFEYFRGCKKASSRNGTCEHRLPHGCKEIVKGGVECECHMNFCNGAGGWTSESLPACSTPGASYLKKSSVDAVIVDLVVLITGVVVAQLLI